MINQPSSIFAGGCIKSHEFLLGTVFLLFHIDICGENRNRIDGTYALSSIASHTRNLCVFFFIYIITVHTSPTYPFPVSVALIVYSFEYNKDNLGLH